jgi:hypothetical protein
MVKTALVATELAVGAKIVSALNDAELSAALWLSPPEYDGWRFVLASRRLDAAGGLNSYR